MIKCGYTIGIILWFAGLIFVGSAAQSPSQKPPPPPPTPASSTSSLASSPANPNVKIAGEITVPAYSLAKLQLQNSTGQVTWIVMASVNNNVEIVPSVTYGNNNTELVFTGVPGTYKVLALSSGNTYTETTVVIQGSSPNPNPKPNPNPNPNPGGGGTDPGIFIYPPSTSKVYNDLTESVARSISNTQDKERSSADAKALSLLYNFCAEKIELDGLKTNPGLKTISQTTLLVKAEESALLNATPLKSLKDVYPDISKAAGEKFLAIMGKSPQQSPTADVLTPEARQAYVNFLRSLAAGFEKAIQ